MPWFLCLPILSRSPHFVADARKACWQAARLAIEATWVLSSFSLFPTLSKKRGAKWQISDQIWQNSIDSQTSTFTLFCCGCQNNKHDIYQRKTTTNWNVNTKKLLFLPFLGNAQFWHPKVPGPMAWIRTSMMNISPVKSTLFDSHCALDFIKIGAIFVTTIRQQLLNSVSFSSSSTNRLPQDTVVQLLWRDVLFASHLGED